MIRARLPHLTPILSALGISVSAYLTWAHYEHDVLVCGAGDCAEVQTSEYATLAGIPIAILGLAMYGAILVLALLRQSVQRRVEELTGIIMFVALCGTLYSAYLTYLEIWEIEAICQWCVASAIIVTLITVTEIASFVATSPEIN